MGERPVPAVSALIVDQGRVLLVKRGSEPNKDLWSLPGGAVELGETIKDALIREVREETSLEIEPTDVAGVRDVISEGPEGIDFHYVVITFRARVTGGELAAGSDAAEARWFHPCEIDSARSTDGLRELLESLGIL
jgi:8-oxo-dGTP diphosphatase